MKKNIVGHMTATKETVSGRIKKWNILPRLLCLLLALLIWLMVVDVQKARAEDSAKDAAVAEDEVS